MSSFDRVTLFHYHLKPGGVTQVIVQSVRALISHLSEVRHISLVCGSSENTRTLMISVRELLDKTGAKTTVSMDVLPAIGYLQPEEVTTIDEASLADELDKRYSGSLWWVHNYHLGKNPLFTRILLKTASDRPEQSILFHIHDFPECGRLGNLSFLLDHVHTPLYPILPNVRYGVINSRDRNLLIRAGIPKEVVFLLHDPVELSVDGDESKESAKRGVAEYASGTPFYYLSEGLNLFYPVRTIRRKNILEAALISRLFPVHTNLIVTLPGISTKEKPYSDLVESCFRAGTITGLWGTGADASSPAFKTVQRASDMVVSTSVQEGFGYLFINALQWQQPLLGRSMAILDGIIDIFSGYPSFFYPSVEVPLKQARRTELLRLYRAHIDAMSRHLPATHIESLSQHMEGMLKKNHIDFSYLPPAFQKEVLENLEDPIFLEELRTRNREVIGSAFSLLEQQTVEKTESIEQFFGLEAFAERINTVFTAFHTGFSQVQWQQGQEIQKNVLEYSFSVEYARLLFADMTGS